MSNNISMTKEHRFYWNYSAAPVSETPPAGGHSYVDRGMLDGSSLDKYINNILVSKFSVLTIDDLPVLYVCLKAESLGDLMQMRGRRSLSGSSSVPFDPRSPPPPNTAHVQNIVESRDTSYHAGGATTRCPQLPPTQQNRASYENLLSEAEEALRRHITHKHNRLYTEQGPDSSNAFLYALCILSTESFDQLCAGVLHASTSNTPSMLPASNTRSRPPDSSENRDSPAAGEWTQVWERKLERFVASAVGALIRFVNDHWERLTRGLFAQESQGDQFTASKQLCRLYHHLELRRLDQDAELHWLRRALALIRNLRDYEEYLEENGHPISEGSSQRFRHAYLTDIYAADSSRSHLDVKAAFKEDLRYAARWMIFIKRFGLGAILVCGQYISKLVYVNLAPLI